MIKIRDQYNFRNNKRKKNNIIINIIKFQIGDNLENLKKLGVIDESQEEIEQKIIYDGLIFKRTIEKYFKNQELNIILEFIKNYPKKLPIFNSLIIKIILYYRYSFFDLFYKNLIDLMNFTLEKYYLSDQFRSNELNLRKMPFKLRILSKNLIYYSKKLYNIYLNLYKQFDLWYENLSHLDEFLRIEELNTSKMILKYINKIRFNYISYMIEIYHGFLNKNIVSKEKIEIINKRIKNTIEYNLLKKYRVIYTNFKEIEGKFVEIKTLNPEIYNNLNIINRELNKTSKGINTLIKELKQNDQIYSILENLKFIEDFDSPLSFYENHFKNKLLTNKPSIRLLDIFDINLLTDLNKLFDIMKYNLIVSKKISTFNFNFKKKLIKIIENSKIKNFYTKLTLFCLYFSIFNKEKVSSLFIEIINELIISEKNIEEIISSQDLFFRLFDQQKLFLFNNDYRLNLNIIRLEKELFNGFINEIFYHIDKSQKNLNFLYSIFIETCRKLFLDKKLIICAKIIGFAYNLGIFKNIKNSEASFVSIFNKKFYDVIKILSVDKSDFKLALENLKCLKVISKYTKDNSYYENALQIIKEIWAEYFIDDKLNILSKS